jgi:adenosylcobyric acid synthase
MGLARHGGLPVIVAGDIDRGGVFAALHGTVALLDRADQALVAGFVINKFRGDAGLLRPGLDMLRDLTGRPTYGVLPWHPDIGLDGEDSLSYVDGRALGRPAPPCGDRWLRVAAIGLPRLSNATDLEALAAEPGVVVRVTTSPADVADADLVVIPGSKATVEDLDWLRATGLADAVTAHAAAGRPLLGLCGGYQMLAERLHDPVESGRGTVPGLGLLPIEITFAPTKTLAHAEGSAFAGVEVRGYEIRHGYVSRRDPRLPGLITAPLEGAVLGNVYGTHWHGAFESDGFRRAFLAAVAPPGFAVAPDTVYADRRTYVSDVVADLVEANLDTDALLRLIERGAPPGLPFLPPGAPVVTERR